MNNDEKWFLYLKTSIVLKIFDFLSWLLGHVKKPTWLEWPGKFQNLWRQNPVNKNNYNTNIAQYLVK